jgi:adenylate cyclase
MEMTPDKWERVKVLFEDALEKSPEQRLQYLAESCADEDLRAEVARLLANLDRAPNFLDEPAVGDFALLAAKSTGGFLAPGRCLAGRFDVTRFLAQGGMGEVYEAKDEELQAQVALKIIRPEFIADQRSLRRFKREVYLAKKVTHQNVCRVFDLFRHRESGANGNSACDVVFISMELLVGDTLSQHLKKRGRVTPEEALPLFTQLASGLDAAHRAGVVHRDLKPSNIILAASRGPGNPRAVITDFGLAFRQGQDVTTVSGQLTTAHALIGTPAYMAPEQFEGGETTPATDIFALGLILYEMITGSRAFGSEGASTNAARHLSTPPTPPRVLVPTLSAAWEAAILRSLEHDPAKRFGSAEAFVQALDGDGLTSRVAVTRSSLPFTEAAEVAWRIAADETARAGRVRIEPLDLLVGICSLSKDYLSRPAGRHRPGPESDETIRSEWADVGNIFDLVGLDPQRLRRAARRQLAVDSNVRAKATPAKVKRSEPSRRVFEHADRIASEAGAESIGVLHILTALIETADRTLIELFASAGIDSSDLKQKLKESISLGRPVEGYVVTASLGASQSPLAEFSSTESGYSRKFRFLCEAPLQFGAEISLSAALDQIITRTVAAVSGAQRGAVLIRDRKSGQLLLKACLPAGQPAVSLTLASRAMREEQGLIWARGGIEASPSIVEHKSETGMYAPLLWRGQCLGVICVETQEPGHVFQTGDLRLLVAIAHHAAMAIANHQLQDDLRLQSTLLERLLTNFSPKIRATLLERAARGRLSLGGEKSEVTILFSDIRGFTKLVSSMPADEVGDMLNQYFSEMAEALFQYDGTIDKFIGDSILAVFGSPEADPDHHMKAVRAALEMQSAVVALNQQRASRGHVTLEMGIGVHCGEVLHGFIGTLQRMEFTVVGDPVNRTARYCAGARPGEVLISPDLHQRVWRNVEVEPCAIPTKHEGDFPAFRVKHCRPPDSV